MKFLLNRWNRTFQGFQIIFIPQNFMKTNLLFLGITGIVRMDDNGDRDADYSLLDLDPVTGRFEVVSHYYGANR